MTDYFTRYDEVLENKLGISNLTELNQAEARICYLRQIEIEAEPLPRKLGFSFLLSLHRRLFGDLYEFAGQMRTVDLAKDGSVFCYVQNIDSEQRRIFSELVRESFLIGKPQETFAQRIAYYSSELNALHPFREGNGRTIRLYLGLLARNAGYIIQYQLCDQESLLSADIEGFKGNIKPLVEIYKQIIQKLDE